MTNETQKNATWRLGAGPVRRRFNVEPFLAGEPAGLLPRVDLKMEIKARPISLTWQGVTSLYGFL